MKRTILCLTILLSLAASGCNFLFKLPFAAQDLIPLEKLSLNEEISPGHPIHDLALVLAPSNGSIRLAGESSGLLEGEIQYNVAEWKPDLVIDGTTARITQPVPEANFSSPPAESVNAWDLKVNETLNNISISLSTGDYTIAFADTLPEGAAISVDSGVGNLRLAFPSNVSARVEVTHGPAGINYEGNWEVKESTYTSGGSGTEWTVQVDIGVGTLTLVSQ